MPQTSGRPRTSSSSSQFPRRNAGRPTGGAPRRSGGGPRRTANSAPRNAAPSPLEQALTAASTLEAPADKPFAEMDLPDGLVAALVKQGMEQPFAIQTRVLPDALAGRDILGRAQTGSGKTLAFGIPVLSRLDRNNTRRAPMQPRALILVPTRELARQVADALIPLANPLGQRITTVVGGLSMSRQIDALRRGIDVLVATPGRLIDLMERRSCDLSAVDITVIDEADHMADLGFLPAVRQIVDATPDTGQRLLLSATLDGGVDALVRDYLTDPAFHAVAQTTDPATAMDHKIFTLKGSDKVAVASEIAARPARTLFFVRTKHGADRLATQLSKAGADATAIHGNLNQNQRQRALNAFAAGHPRVLVATDVAARGIHVDDVDLVVHYDLPNDHKDYLHRSGRTARAGARGTVVSFVEPFQGRDVARLHRDASVTASSDSVYVGHDAVRELAASGEPVVVKPIEEPRGRGGRNGESRSSRGPRSGGGYRGDRPASDRGTSGGYRGERPVRTEGGDRGGFRGERGTGGYRSEGGYRSDRPAGDRPAGDRNGGGYRGNAGRPRSGASY